MRGTLRVSRIGGLWWRIIPAYAGNTIRKPKILLSPWGSSPRMRGTQIEDRGPVIVGGIIPAYAGNTVVRVRRLPWLGDHPRVCGEHFASAKQLTTRRGSSPRMRGTLGDLGTQFTAAGIIPAYAGNTACREATSSSPRDHPRVCGEHLPITLPKHVRQGSSPRMRGTPRQRHRPGR